jgi:electron transfer flavoprotein beta subunit
MKGPVVVLVSIGCHPGSGRPWRARSDAAALELALRLQPEGIECVHAGPGDDEVLRAYAGMGLARVKRLDVPEHADIHDPLARLLASIRPRLVLCGERTELGDRSGFTPYALAAALDLPLLAACVDIVPGGSGWQAVVAEPGGRRRRLRVAGDTVASVSPLAPAPRYPAPVLERRAVVEVVPVIGPTKPLPRLVLRPPRPRPRPMRLPAAGASAEDRLAAATTFKSGRRSVLRPPSPAAAAQALIDVLRRHRSAGLRHPPPEDIDV